MMLLFFSFGGRFSRFVCDADYFHRSESVIIEGDVRPIWYVPANRLNSIKEKTVKIQLDGWWEKRNKENTYVSDFFKPEFWFPNRNLSLSEWWHCWKHMVHYV